MAIIDFTVEEINLIAIYKAETKEATLQAIAAALPFMDGEMQIISENACRKLAALSDEEYCSIPFTPADDTGEA